MPEEAAQARAVPIGGDLELVCVLCRGTAFWRRYPKAVDRSNQLLLLAEDEAVQSVTQLRKDPRWPGFAEVCANCGFVHWFSSEAITRRPSPG